MHEAKGKIRWFTLSCGSQWTFFPVFGGNSNSTMKKNGAVLHDIHCHLLWTFFLRCIFSVFPISPTCCCCWSNALCARATGWREGMFVLWNVLVLSHLVCHNTNNQRKNADVYRSPCQKAKVSASLAMHKTILRMALKLYTHSPGRIIKRIENDDACQKFIEIHTEIEEWMEAAAAAAA